ncbi:MAG: iron ABC transporter substrate-binding protein [Actinomycetota bacterium]|nr:iron ABC transporter substrate-binding protein [Actinomycetota bacterium]
MRQWWCGLATVMVMALLLALAGCGGGGAGTGDSQLVIYSGRQEGLVGPLIERFEQQTGIATSVRYGNTAQLSAQLLEEGESTPADVFFSQDAGALGALSRAGRLEQLPPAVLDTVPARFRGDDGNWVGVSGRARVIVYDPRKVAEQDVPDSVFELTDPRWRGQVGIAPSNASFESFVTAMRVLRGEDATRKWLEDMRANDVQSFDNNVLILNAVNDGLLSLGLINHYYWYEQVAERGPGAVPSRLKFLPGGDPGALVNVAGVGILRGADHATQAHQFVEFLLSWPPQSYFAEETKEYPLVAGVAPVADLPPLESLQTPQIDLSDLSTLNQTLEMIQGAGLT